MQVKLTAIAGLTALTLSPAIPAAAQTASPWLHIRVEEAAKQSKVRVNLPMNVVEAALKAAPEKVVSEGRIKIGREGHGLAVADLRRLWKELKVSGDAELVSVEDKDQNVKVSRRGDLVQVHVEKPGGREQVYLEVPVSLVDALFQGDGETLDVRAAVGELAKRRGDVVRVNDDDSNVRIWIDEKSSD